eukprot:2587490-Lingulodinium_polyedra.AAC.1
MAAAQFTNVAFDTMPCLVASRGGRGGYCAASLVELARVQGWKSADIRQVLRSCQSQHHVGKGLGNGM